MSNNLRQAAQAALESALDEWIETDPDMAERWITEKLAQLALKQRLKDRRAALAAPQPELSSSETGNVKHPEPVELMNVRAIVQQAHMALEELQGPGYLIGGVMHHRIDLILPKLNAAIDFLAAPPAQQPLTDKQIDATYCESQDQDLRPQDKSRVFAFARAIERAHGIGVKP